MAGYAAAGARYFWTFEFSAPSHTSSTARSRAAQRWPSAAGAVSFHAYELGPDGTYKLTEQGKNDDIVAVTLTIGATEVPITVSCASLVA